MHKKEGRKQQDRPLFYMFYIILFVQNDDECGRSKRNLQDRYITHKSKIKTTEPHFCFYFTFRKIFFVS